MLIVKCSKYASLLVMVNVTFDFFAIVFKSSAKLASSDFGKIGFFRVPYSFWYSDKDVFNSL